MCNLTIDHGWYAERARALESPPIDAATWERMLRNVDTKGRGR